MIFISYRISDALDLVGRLDADLTREFGSDAVFRDKTRLQAGKNWTDQLTSNATTRSVMLLVIGATWQSTTFADGEQKGFPRLSDPDDWVRKEITLSLNAERAVLPVFLNGATMPSEGWLKKCGLERLHEKQGLPLRSIEYDSDYAALVADLCKLCSGLDKTRKPSVPAKAWSPAVLYPLQPAPHFAGREKLLLELAAWAREPSASNRVVSLVAAGGTGKTAVAEKVVTTLADFTTSGVFVWSFYENPQTEAFLRSACEYFFGEVPKETGGLLERLQHGLRADVSAHVLVLDGLELVQATGTSGRPRGSIEDPTLKRFLRWLAAGLGTCAKALITSRFPLPDLVDWVGKGYRTILLDDLDAPAARAVLRRWGMLGSDATLDALSDSVHRHALTVDVLGSYLGTFHGGQPSQAPSFDPQFWSDTDPKTARLHRVLTSYAEKISPQERDLLARLSAFPRGIGPDVIGYLIDAGGEVAATLIGCGQPEILKLLERLRLLGLVFRYEAGGLATFTAHPFLRGFFEKLLGVTDPKQIHETVRQKLAAGLEEQPDKKPTDPLDLDRYERLIEITRLAGDTQKAFDLYLYGLGSYRHLGWVCGENYRGLRILSGFSSDGTPDSYVAVEGNENNDTNLLRAWANFASGVGDVETARAAGLAAAKICLHSGNYEQLYSVTGNLAITYMQQAKWPEALRLTEQALDHALKTEVEEYKLFASSMVASIWYRLGGLQKSRDCFSKSIGTYDDAITYCISSLRRIEFFLTMQVQDGFVRSRSEEILALAKQETNLGMEAMVRILLAVHSCRSGMGEYHSHLKNARAYATRSGHIELSLRVSHSAAEIARHEKDFTFAVAEALDGIQLADSCGYGRWSLEIRIELATIYLAAGEPAKVIEPAEWVLNRSQEPDCQFAWGTADSLHLLGVAHARLGDMAKARDYLRRAIEKRAPLEHPGLKETEGELAKLVG